MNKTADWKELLQTVAKNKNATKTIASAGGAILGGAAGSNLVSSEDKSLGMIGGATAGAIAGYSGGKALFNHATEKATETVAKTTNTTKATEQLTKETKTEAVPKSKANGKSKTQHTPEPTPQPVASSQPVRESIWSREIGSKKPSTPKAPTPSKPMPTLNAADFAGDGAVSTLPKSISAASSRATSVPSAQPKTSSPSIFERASVWAKNKFKNIRSAKTLAETAITREGVAGTGGGIAKNIASDQMQNDIRSFRNTPDDFAKAASRALYYAPGALAGALIGSMNKTQDPLTGEYASNPGSVLTGALFGTAAGHIAGKKIPQAIFKKKLLGELDHTSAVRGISNKIVKSLDETSGQYIDKVVPNGLSDSQVKSYSNRINKHMSKQINNVHDVSFMTPAEIDEVIGRMKNKNFAREEAAAYKEITPMIQKDLVGDVKTRINTAHRYDHEQMGAVAKFFDSLGIHPSSFAKRKDLNAVRKAGRIGANDVNELIAH